ncbi:MAG TPA: hypothetical protein PKO06_24445, partial [Candidatus Ozemobacteraceae bacterium]|nr:hypothetical protein [Candidatus Ozemobacteraceae bacterium]
MKKWCLLSLCCCWAVMGERSVNAAESVPPKSSKWDVVKEYLRRDREGGGRDVSMRPVATDSSTLPGSDGSANDPWAVQ